MIIVKKILIVILLSSISIFINAQEGNEDWIKYDYSFYFKEGLYQDFNSFRNNSPLPFESLVYPLYSDPNFFKILDTTENIIYNDRYGLSVELSSEDLWGYSRNGKPYIYWSGKYNLIPYVGSISHFITTVIVHYSSYRDPFYDPYYYNPSARIYESEEIRQFIIDMKTGIILEYNQKNVESILQREPEIYEEFSALSRRKKNKELFYYVRLYNEKQALMVPE